jgi:protein-tyrosine phosphatase
VSDEGESHDLTFEDGMSLKYSFVFLILAFACVVLTLVLWEYVGWYGVAFLYSAISFLLLSIAYAGAGAGLLLKQASGRHSILGMLLFGPYFVLNALTFILYRLMSKEPAYAQVAPNVFFGRRLTPGECKEERWNSVLDLAGEFAEVQQLRKLAGYKSLPVLDATAPMEDQLRLAVSWMADRAASGPVYVHCALGHGRSACVVIAYLLSVGAVGTVGEGVLLLRSLRPGVRLHPVQRKRLRAFEKMTGQTRHLK